MKRKKIIFFLSLGLVVIIALAFYLSLPTKIIFTNDVNYRPSIFKTLAKEKILNFKINERELLINTFVYYLERKRKNEKIMLLIDYIDQSLIEKHKLNVIQNYRTYPIPLYVSKNSPTTDFAECLKICKFEYKNPIIMYYYHLLVNSQEKKDFPVEKLIELSEKNKDKDIILGVHPKKGKLVFINNKKVYSTYNLYTKDKVKVGIAKADKKSGAFFLFLEREYPFLF